MIEINLEDEKKALAREYRELLRISYQTLTDADKKLIRKAFDVAVAGVVHVALLVSIQVTISLFERELFE